MVDRDYITCVELNCDRTFRRSLLSLLLSIIIDEVFLDTIPISRSTKDAIMAADLSHTKFYHKQQLG